MTRLLAAGGPLAENRQMSDELKTTVRIQRPARIHSDGRNRSVCAEPVEIAEFELLSTVALKKILRSNDESAKKSIAAAAKSGDQGVLATCFRPRVAEWVRNGGRPGQWQRAHPLR